MKKLLWILLIVGLSAANPIIATAQQQESKKEQKQREHLEKISKMVADKSFKFLVRSIDVAGSPDAAYGNLSGGYMVKITPQEMTVYLPSMGPYLNTNPQGVYQSLSYAVPNYKMTVEKKSDGVVIAIKSKDPKGDFEYDYIITCNSMGERLTVKGEYQQNITYTGGMMPINQK